MVIACNLVAGRFSRILDWVQQDNRIKKTGVFRILDRSTFTIESDFCFSMVFLKRKKLTDTGLFPNGFFVDTGNFLWDGLVFLDTE